jgi:hypothetical protein
MLKRLKQLNRTILSNEFEKSRGIYYFSKINPNDFRSGENLSKPTFSREIRKAIKRSTIKKYQIDS